MKALYLPALISPSNSLWVPHMKHLYLPAILPTTLYDGWKLRPVNWMDPRGQGAGAYYPHVLLSFYGWERARFKFEPNTFVFGDSGGYSVVTMGARIDPATVIRWQLKNCNVGVILDSPPFVSTGGAILQGAAATNWQKALRSSIASTRRALPIYLDALERGSEFRWWGVVHGETLEQLDEWWGRVMEIYSFAGEGEGWALKVHPANNPVQLARVLHFVKRMGIKRAHFFQMTGLEALTTLFTLGPDAGLDLVTYDSAGASFAGINRAVYVPTTKPLPWVDPVVEKFREAGETFARDYMRDQCECASCIWLREDLQNDSRQLVINEEYWKYRMIFHNTLIFIQTLNDLYAAVNAKPGPHALQTLLGEKTWPILRAFEGREPHNTILGAPRSLLDYAQ